MIYAIYQRHQDAISQYFRSNGAKRRFERSRLYRDPDDVKLLVEPIGDPYRRLKVPERLALNAQALGVAIPPARTHEQGHRMTSLCEHTAHKSADSTRSENRVSHRPPPPAVCTPFYTASTRLGGANATCPQYRLESRRADSNRFPAHCELAKAPSLLFYSVADIPYIGCISAIRSARLFRSSPSSYDARVPEWFKATLVLLPVAGIRQRRRKVHRTP